jgi:protein involved in polysaccharide export with SLBB domain/capsular polysaccharide biosynthesis protein
MKDDFDAKRWLPGQGGRYGYSDDDLHLREGPLPYRTHPPDAAHNGEITGARVSFWTILDLLMRHWWKLALGSMLCGALFFLAAERFIGPNYTATARLLRYSTPGLGDFFNSGSTMTRDTFAGLLRSPDLLRRVGQTVSPPIAPEVLTKRIVIGGDQDSDSDIVTVSLASDTPQQAVSLLNEYIKEASAYLRDLQAKEVRQVANAYLRKEVEEMDKDIKVVDQQFRRLALASPEVTSQLANVGGQITNLAQKVAGGVAPSAFVRVDSQRLAKAISDLDDLLTKYTERWPAVIQKRAEIKALKSEIASESTNATLPSLPAIAVGGAKPLANPELDLIRSKLLALEGERAQLANRERQAELLAATPPGIARVFAPATMKTVHVSKRWLKVSIVAVFGMGLGLVGCLGLLAIVEFADNRLKTFDDVERVTRLPVLGSLGNLDRMGDQARRQWAFRTWTMLQGRLSPSPNHGFVCGITSASPGEGRSTWVRLLAEAASLTGFRVLTIATRPAANGTEGHGSQDKPKDKEQEKEELQSLALEFGGSDRSIEVLASSALTSPRKVADQLAEPDAPPMVHIPLPGWVWNLERRKQWLEALQCWRRIENLVILVELPPAGVAESVLLGSSLPNLLWLTRSGSSNAGETREQLETLRNARCRLAGAVINREKRRPMKKRFPRWVACACLVMLPGAGRTWAQGANTPPATPAASGPSAGAQVEINTNRTFSIVYPWQRAAWQQHLTLGPGDVLNFGLFGQPNLELRDVVVGPDGRVSYLEAQDIQAAGLTIDGLRDKLNAALSLYRRAPRAIVTPVAFRSEKYYMLGEVVQKGVYAMDGPVSVLEAIARAKGFESGLVDGKVVELADFSHSFIARQGKRLGLNLAGLFRGGDLSQNVALEPGDYVYIAPLNLEQVYVLGQVRLPGTAPYSSSGTLLRAIAARGGFAQRAYKSRVLVVRGPLEHPQRIVVNTDWILRGKAPDFPLQPKDIIYISGSPFARVEDLADLATTAFIQSLISTWLEVRVIQPFNP